METMVGFNELNGWEFKLIDRKYLKRVMLHAWYTLLWPSI